MITNKSSNGDTNEGRTNDIERGCQKIDNSSLYYSTTFRGLYSPMFFEINSCLP